MERWPNTEQRWQDDIEWKRGVDDFIKRMEPIADAADGIRALGRFANFFASIVRIVARFVAMCANKFRNGVLWWAPIVGLGVTIYGFATDKLHQWASSFMSNFR